MINLFRLFFLITSFTCKVFAVTYDYPTTLKFYKDQSLSDSAGDVYSLVSNQDVQLMIGVYENKDLFATVKNQTNEQVKQQFVETMKGTDLMIGYSNRQLLEFKINNEGVKKSVSIFSKVTYQGEVYRELKTYSLESGSTLYTKATYPEDMASTVEKQIIDSSQKTRVVMSGVYNNEIFKSGVRFVQNINIPENLLISKYVKHFYLGNYAFAQGADCKSVDDKYIIQGEYSTRPGSAIFNFKKLVNDLKGESQKDGAVDEKKIRCMVEKVQSARDNSADYWEHRAVSEGCKSSGQPMPESRPSDCAESTWNEFKKSTSYLDAINDQLESIGSEVPVEQVAESPQECSRRQNLAALESLKANTIEANCCFNDGEEKGPLMSLMDDQQRGVSAILGDGDIQSKTLQCIEKTRPSKLSGPKIAADVALGCLQNIGNVIINAIKDLVSSVVSIFDGELISAVKTMYANIRKDGIQKALISPMMNSITSMLADRAEAVVTCMNGPEKAKYSCYVATQILAMFLAPTKIKQLIEALSAGVKSSKMVALLGKAMAKIPGAKTVSKVAKKAGRGIDKTKTYLAGTAAGAKAIKIKGILKSVLGKDLAKPTKQWMAERWAKMKSGTTSRIAQVQSQSNLRGARIGQGNAQGEVAHGAKLDSPSAQNLRQGEVQIPTERANSTSAGPPEWRSGQDSGVQLGQSRGATSSLSDGNSFGPTNQQGAVPRYEVPVARQVDPKPSNIQVNREVKVETPTFEAAPADLELPKTKSARYNQLRNQLDNVEPSYEEARRLFGVKSEKGAARVVADKAKKLRSDIDSLVRRNEISAADAEKMKRRISEYEHIGKNQKAGHRQAITVQKQESVSPRLQSQPVGSSVPVARTEVKLQTHTQEVLPVSREVTIPRRQEVSIVQQPKAPVTQAKLVESRQLTVVQNSGAPNVRSVEGEFIQGVNPSKLPTTRAAREGQVIDGQSRAVSEPAIRGENNQLRLGQGQDGRVNGQVSSINSQNVVSANSPVTRSASSQSVRSVEGEFIQGVIPSKLPTTRAAREGQVIDGQSRAVNDTPMGGNNQLRLEQGKIGEVNGQARLANEKPLQISQDRKTIESKMVNSRELSTEVRSLNSPNSKLIGSAEVRAVEGEFIPATKKTNLPTTRSAKEGEIIDGEFQVVESSPRLADSKAMQQRPSQVLKIKHYEASEKITPPQKSEAANSSSVSVKEQPISTTSVPIVDRRSASLSRPVVVDSTQSVRITTSGWKPRTAENANGTWENFNSEARAQQILEKHEANIRKFQSSQEAEIETRVAAKAKELKADGKDHNQELLDYREQVERGLKAQRRKDSTYVDERQVASAKAVIAKSNGDLKGYAEALKEKMQLIEGDIVGGNSQMLTDDLLKMSGQDAAERAKSLGVAMNADDASLLAFRMQRSGLVTDSSSKIGSVYNSAIQKQASAIIEKARATLAIDFNKDIRLPTSAAPVGSKAYHLDEMAALQQKRQIILSLQNSVESKTAKYDAPTRTKFGQKVDVELERIDQELNQIRKDMNKK